MELQLSNEIFCKVSARSATIEANRRCKFEFELVKFEILIKKQAEIEKVCQGCELFKLEENLWKI